MAGSFLSRDRQTDWLRVIVMLFHFAETHWKHDKTIAHTVWAISHLLQKQSRFTIERQRAAASHGRLTSALTWFMCLSHIHILHYTKFWRRRHKGGGELPSPHSAGIASWKYLTSCRVEQDAVLDELLIWFSRVLLTFVFFICSFNTY